MSGILTGPYFQSYFQHPTAFEIATMVSILEIGAFIGSLLVGTVGHSLLQVIRTTPSLMSRILPVLFYDRSVIFLAVKRPSSGAV